MLIKLSGEYGEGGGSLIRIALSLSLLTGKPFEADNIRKGREVPGLKAQHLHCIKGAQQLCDAKADGAELGSEYLKFVPSKLKSKSLSLDVGTAGAVTLVLQSLLMPCMFLSKPIRIELIGGTDSKWSPSFDYFTNVFLPQLRRFAKIEARLLKRGYYPKGNGKVEVKINPRFKFNESSNFDEFHQSLKEKVKKYDLVEQHHLIQIKGVSHASSNLQQARVAERQAHSAQAMLGKKFNAPIKITSEYQDTLSTGSGITLWAIFSKNKEDIDENAPIRVGADALGEQGKKAEIVGEEAANNLIKEIESKAPVDRHLADQMLPYMALLSGSRLKVSEITNHCRTNIYTIQQFLGNASPRGLWNDSDKIFSVDEKEMVILSNETFIFK